MSNVNRFFNFNSVYVVVGDNLIPYYRRHKDNKFLITPIILNCLLTTIWKIKEKLRKKLKITLTLFTKFY
jgi:hypothetical protein